MFYTLDKNLFYHLLSYLYPNDLVSLCKTVNHKNHDYWNKIQTIYRQSACGKIDRFFQNYFGKDYSNFWKEMSQAKAVVSGSFILQNAWDEIWKNSDVDIFIPIKGVQLSTSSSNNPKTPLEDFLYNDHYFSYYYDANCYRDHISNKLKFVRSYSRDHEKHIDCRFRSGQKRTYSEQQEKIQCDPLQYHVFHKKKNLILIYVFHFNVTTRYFYSVETMSSNPEKQCPQCPYVDTEHPSMYKTHCESDDPLNQTYEIRRNHMANHDTVVVSGLSLVEAKAAFLDVLLEMGYWPVTSSYGFNSTYVCYNYGAHAEGIWISPKPPDSEAMLKRKEAKQKMMQRKQKREKKKKERLEAHIKKQLEEQSLGDKQKRIEMEMEVEWYSQ